MGGPGRPTPEKLLDSTVGHSVKIHGHGNTWSFLSGFPSPACAACCVRAEDGAGGTAPPGWSISGWSPGRTGTCRRVGIFDQPSAAPGPSIPRRVPVDRPGAPTSPQFLRGGGWSLTMMSALACVNAIWRSSVSHRHHGVVLIPRGGGTAELVCAIMEPDDPSDLRSRFEDWRSWTRGARTSSPPTT